MCGGRGYGKSLYLPLSFAVNLKLLSKHSLKKKKKKRLQKTVDHSTINLTSVVFYCAYLLIIPAWPLEASEFATL